MNSIDSVTLEVADTEAAARFYADAFGLDGSRVRVRASASPTSGFRGFTLSLVVAQPGNVDALFTAAVDAGAAVLKPAAKSLVGLRRGRPGAGRHGLADRDLGEEGHRPGHPRRRRDRAPPGRRGRQGHQAVLRGAGRLTPWARATAGSTSSSATGPGAVKLSLYKRRALAKVAGVSAEGTGSHRLVVSGGTRPFDDPDGFTWQPELRH
ncbi:VOC family protein [Streptomyces violaceorubidus]